MYFHCSENIDSSKADIILTDLIDKNQGLHIATTTISLFKTLEETSVLLGAQNSKPSLIIIVEAVHIAALFFLTTKTFNSRRRLFQFKL